eukprot:353035-Hanusia_phi.AAC.1
MGYPLNSEEEVRSGGSSLGGGRKRARGGESKRRGGRGQREGAEDTGGSTEKQDDTPTRCVQEVGNASVRVSTCIDDAELSGFHHVCCCLIEHKFHLVVEVRIVVQDDQFVVDACQM